MGKKWGSNEDIHVGDIFQCWSPIYDVWWEYYQVVELRGKSQVVLHAVYSERYINEIIPEDSPLYWRREQSRPLRGKFASLDDPVVRWGFWKQNAYIELTTEKMTAWVLPEREDDGRIRLQAMGLLYQKTGYWFSQGLPEDWEPWDEEKLRENEEYVRQLAEEADKSWNERMERIRNGQNYIYED